MTWNAASIVLSKNRQSRRLARKLGLKADELMLAFSTGLVQSAQRRISAELRDELRGRLAEAKKIIAEAASEEAKLKETLNAS